MVECQAIDTVFEHQMQEKRKKSSLKESKMHHVSCIAGLLILLSKRESLSIN